MTKNEARVAEITKRLTDAFAPAELDVIDESHLHAGHAGAKSGLGHFAVSITADAFANKNPLERHRMIYDTLGDLMQTDIHALRVVRASG
jgi:stress-induced morphogen